MSRPLVLLALLGSTLAASPCAAAEEDVLATLRRDHPRLLVLDDDVARLKKQIETDATAKAYFEHVRAAGEKVLAQPPSQRQIIGPRLLHISRQVLGRVKALAGLYRLTGDEKYADRCREEMLAAAAFVDWNPSHFLDVAEMTNALGIGYDWLFDKLSDADRKTVRDAIVEKGLKPGLKVYASERGFHKTTNNWNQVCNGGLVVGALAVADEESEIARQVIVHARNSIPRAMKAFAPEGGCIEGPAYWGYATEYITYYGAALQTALGDDFGFFDSPGMPNTGMFRIHTLGPTDRTYNFADAGDTSGGAPQMFYFARVYDQPAYAAHERMFLQRKRSIDPLHLLWFNSAGTKQDVEMLPTAAKFDGVEVVTMRSGWDRDAAFVGFKGGDNAASHAHLDLGGFVYDADGVRWAIDIGRDEYNLPGYFGKQRWTYYRLRTEGQNTLTIDGQNQNVKGKAKIVEFSPGPQKRFGVADLTNGYEGQATRVTRRVELIGRELQVHDEVEAAKPVEVVWHMHTAAKIEVQEGGRSAVLTRDGKRLVAHVSADSAAQFAVDAADPPPDVDAVPRAMAKLTRYPQKLVVRLPEKTAKLALTVRLVPDSR